MEPTSANYPGTADPGVVLAVEPPLVDFQGACVALAISERQLRREMDAGAIAAKVRGRKVLFEPSELRRYATDLPSWEPK